MLRWLENIDPKVSSWRRTPNEILHADHLIRGTKSFIMPTVNTKKSFLPYQANFIPELRLQTRKQAENEQTVNRGYLWQ